jgi:hypothetical protein
MLYAIVKIAKSLNGPYPESINPIRNTTYCVSNNVKIYQT